MKIGYKNAMICAIGLLFSIFMPAQEIPKLPTDGSVTRGLLPNGMEYFVIENPTHKGMADFAIVSRADNGVLHKRNVETALSEYVIDSTLLSLMALSDNASPADHAVIVAGDVKTPAVKEKIRMLSYMTPVRDAQTGSPYVWNPEDELKVVTEERPDSRIAVITARWNTPRTSPELMTTIQPAISSLFMGQLGIIAGNRLENAFRQEGIPVTGVGHSYVSSSMSPGDESFIVTLTVGPENLDQAVRILASVMSSIDSGTVTVQEVNRSHERYIEELYSASSHPIRSNAEYIDRCVSAFLYGGSLASMAQVYGFHTSRYLLDETELNLFNGIASAVLDKENNLTINVSSPQSVDSKKIAETFSAAWGEEQSDLTYVDRVETDAFLKSVAPEKKMKISSSKKDPISGGAAFSLENGLNVICRKQPADNRIYFSLALNGGYGNVQGLSSGEGAFFSDYLYTCKVAGIPMKDFLDALEARGVRIEFETGMSSTSISGSASRYELLTVIQALAMLTGSLEKDDSELDYYLRTVPLQLESLKGTSQARMAAIDAIMCPGYIWSDMKSELPGEGFGDKAWKFYESQFAKLDDGVLVITGDVDETDLRRHLAIYGHQFSTLKKTSQRPYVRYQPISGVSVCTVKGMEDVIDYAMSARCPFTSDNHVAATAATLAMTHRLSEAFKGSGWSADLRHEFMVYPEERFSVVITLSKTEEDGLSHSDAMSRLRATVAAMTDNPLKKNQVDMYAAYLKNRMTLLAGDPSFWTEAIAGRRIFGKDIVSGYSAKCDALTAQKIQNIISSLLNSGKVEYITKENHVSRNHN